jgi:hypothetical protein
MWAKIEGDPPSADGGEGWCAKSIFGTLFFLVKSIGIVLAKSLFFTGNFVFKFENNRNGTVRSAIFLLFFTIAHAGGNAYDFWVGAILNQDHGDQVNGETYFFERQHINFPIMYWHFGAGAIEIYLLLGGILHVSVALKRSWDISMDYCLYTGKWNMLLTGLVVLAFVIKHLQDFRFYDKYQFTQVRPPPLFVNPLGAPFGKLWTMGDDKNVKPATIRDSYSREYDVFADPWTCVWYVFCIFMFTRHMVWGWAKAVTSDALRLPSNHQTRVKYIGWALAVSLGMMYGSLPPGYYFTTRQAVPHVPAPAPEEF